MRVRYLSPSNARRFLRPLVRPLGVRGITVANMMVVVLVLGILSVPMAKFLTSNLQTLTKENIKVTSQDSVREAMDRIERDLFSLNQVYATGSVSGRSTIRFGMDWNQSPFYTGNPADPDDDADIGQVWSTAPNARWSVGSDMKDEDDDNDGNHDVICRYQVDGNLQLIRECLFNASGGVPNPAFPAVVIPRSGSISTVVGGGRHVAERLAANVSTFTLTYFGAKREMTVAANDIDVGTDGVLGAADADGSQQDGIITQREMDWVLAPRGRGNRNDQVDGAELDYIYSIHIVIGQDRNRDGVLDFRLETEVSPPFLPLRRTGGREI